MDFQKAAVNNGLKLCHIVFCTKDTTICKKINWNYETESRFLVSLWGIPPRSAHHKTLLFNVFCFRFALFCNCACAIWNDFSYYLVATLILYWRTIKCTFGNSNIKSVGHIISCPCIKRFGVHLVLQCWVKITKSCLFPLSLSTHWCKWSLPKSFYWLLNSLFFLSLFPLING